MWKQRARKDEKMLNIVSAVPYFKGVTRKNLIKIAACLEKHKPCIN